MKKKLSLPIFITAFLITVSALFFNTTNYYADRSMIDPSYFQYSVNSYIGAWYDPQSGCFLLQTLDNQKTNENYYQTRVMEFSRIKTVADGSSYVNPTDAKYVTDREATLDEKDPHIYRVVSSNANHAILKDGNYYDRQYVAFDRMNMPVENDTVTLPNENGSPTRYAYTTFILDQELVFSAIKNKYPDWYAEITYFQSQNIPVWLGLDSVMIAHYPSSEMANYRIDNTSNDFGWTGYAGQLLKVTIGGGEYYRWSNWEDLSKYFPNSLGSFETGKGIYTHYNKYVCLSADVIPPTDNAPVTGVTDTIIGTEVIAKSYGDSNVSVGMEYNGSYDIYSAPSTYTYNTSNEFNLGEAIPSTESYTNGINVSNWYGSVTVDLHKVTYTMNIPYTIVTAEQGEKTQYVQVRTTTEMSPGDHDGLIYPATYDSFDGTYYYYTCSYQTSDSKVNYYTNVYTYDVEGYYYAVNNINLYQHDFTKIDNTFSSVTYDASAIIPYTVTINGQTVSSMYGNKFSTTTFAADTNAHVQVPSTLTAAPINIRVGEDVSSAAEAHAYMGQIVAQKYGNYGLITTNDTVSLNGVTYISPTDKNYTATNGAYYIGDAYNDRTLATRRVTIPAETQNGEYYTSLRSEYAQMVAGYSSNTIRLHGKSDAKRGILSGYKQNEPIIVHTPVISPISIKGEDETQLVNSALSKNDTQLILDNTYTLTFDWETYFHYKGYTKENFVDYVKGKEVRFPFDVIVDGVSYTTYESIGYTDWIDVGNVDSFEFYLPSWAEENVYGSDTFDDGIINRIQARVYAVNYIDDEREKWQESANTNRAKYMATYDYPVQVSGVLYDFKIVSVNDTALFDEEVKEVEKAVYNFVRNLSEKTNGVLNRFGLSNIRYTLNGEINSQWNTENTLPTGNGNTPLLYCGHTFGFTLKSIANLGDSKDSIEIVPVYRYIGKDGSQKEVSVYYERAGKLINIYEDDYYRKTHIGSEYFKGSMYDYGIYDPVTFTAEQKNTTTNDILYRETESFSAGKIILPSALSLLTGNEEQLFVNQASNSIDSLRYNIENGLENIGAETYEDFESSMQTWYGNYTIPNDIYVCEKTQNGSDAYLDLVKEEGVCSPDSEIWLKDGYLVLGFEITSKNEGKPHLSYYGAASNMWQTQSGGAVPEVEVEYYDPINDETHTVKVPLKDGDIAIIDMGRKYSDRYSLGILYIN